jgi:hydrogenase expression/formation protein HypC
MCLAIPGKVIEIATENGLKVGRIDFSGAVYKTCLEYVPEVTVGQYVLVHAGFAISVVNEEEARETLQLWDELIHHDADKPQTGSETAIGRKVD